MGVWIETGIGKSEASVLKSHPSWVCGLKLVLSLFVTLARLSHPSWVCGLKQKSQENVNRSIEVTPFVGVWIETLEISEGKLTRQVTPFVGVWIETR